MPVILPPEACPKWLGEQPAETAELLGMLRPWPVERTRSWPVSTRVNGVRNDDTELLAPIAVGPER